MEAWLLGSGGWFPAAARETTSVFVRAGGRGLLIDAGTGARRLLTDSKLVEGLTSLDVVLTHFHLDHVCGLLYLPGLVTIGALENPPRAWAPGKWLYEIPSRELLDRVLLPPMSPFPGPAVEVVHELNPGAQQIGPFEIRALAQQRHWGPTAGLRINDELAFITDTAREAEHASLAHGVTHLLHQAWSTSAAPIFSDHDATARDAAMTASDSAVQSLTLIHLNPLGDFDAILADARETFVGAELGEDGHRIRLSNSD